MATYTKTVDPNGGADYLSIALWEAGEQALYSSGDIAIADCKRTGSTKDTTAVTIDGWTDGVIPKVIVNSAHRHEGKWADTQTGGNYIYVVSITAGYSSCIRSLINAAEFEGLLLEATDANSECLRLEALSQKASSIITKAGLNGVRFVNFGTGSHTLVNVVAYGGQFGIKDQRGDGNSSRYCKVYNCTSYGASLTGIHAGYGTEVFNCISTGSGTDFFSENSYAAGANYNVSSDATAPGTNVAINKTAYATYFVDHLNGDFHLTDTSENLFGLASLDFSATFTTDIDGDTRTASSAFGLGADFYVSGGGGGVTEEASASFSQTFGFSSSKTAIIDASASFSQSFGMAQGGAGLFNTDAQMGALLAMAAQTTSDINAQIEQGITSSLISVSNSIVNADATIHTTHDIIAAGGITLVAAADFIVNYGISSDSDISIEALADFGMSCGILCSAIAQIDASIDINAVHGAVVETIAVINASASFGVTSGLSITRTVTTEAGVTFSITSTLASDGSIQVDGVVIPDGKRTIKLLATERSVRLIQVIRSIKDLGE